MIAVLHKSAPGFLRVIAAVCVAHFLAVLAMAASPALHELVHNHAHEHDHECAVTDMLAAGAGDGVPVQAVAVIFLLPQQFSSVAEFDPEWVASRFLSSCVFEHAPPAQI